MQWYTYGKPSFCLAKSFSRWKGGVHTAPDWGWMVFSMLASISLTIYSFTRICTSKHRWHWWGSTVVGKCEGLYMMQCWISISQIVRISLIHVHSACLSQSRQMIDHHLAWCYKLDILWYLLNPCNRVIIREGCKHLEVLIWMLSIWCTSHKAIAESKYLQFIDSQ